MVVVAALALLAAAHQQVPVAGGGNPAKQNILLIVVDDLRPEVAYEGEKFMHTPNIDKLAQEGLVFNRAYCQQAICGPTRNSFLSGRRPQRTKVCAYRTQAHQPPRNSQQP